MMKNKTFQILTVIGIINVLAGHVDLDTFPLLNNWFPPYSFHMALFAFISGYFYKENNHLNGKAVASYCLRKFKHLIVPAYLWNIAYGGLVYFLSFFGFTIGEMPDAYRLFVAPFTDGQQFAYNMTSWFVVPLFLVEVIYAMVRFLSRKWDDAGHTTQIVAGAVHLVIALSLGMSAIYVVIAGYTSFLCLLYLKVTFFYVFFLLGRAYQGFLEKRDTLPSSIYFTVILLIQALILYKCNRLDYVLSNGSQFENGVMIPFITACTGIAFYLRVAKILTPGLEKSRIIDVLCRYSYSIMLHQFLGFMFVKGMVGVCQSLFGMFPDFSILVMKVNIWYYYFPANTAAFGLFYFAGGILIPIFIGFAQEKVSTYFRKKMKK